MLVEVDNSIINSMTAYASSQHRLDGLGLLACEVKTVNSRFVDLYIKAPDYLTFLETKIRSLISSRISRGKVDCVISVKFDPDFKIANFYSERVSEYLSLYKNLQEQSQSVGIRTQDLSLAELLKEMSGRDSYGVSKQQLSNVLDSAFLHDFEQSILDLINKTFDSLILQRQREGFVLKNELQTVLNSLNADISKLEEILPEAQQEYIAKFQQKFTKYAGTMLDEISQNNKELKQDSDFEVKLAHEMAIYLNKIDISEELARLKLHATEVSNLITNGGVVGRKLDFLMQELMREANTLSAKSVHIDFRNIAINLKVYIEQLREQIQNIE